MMVWTFLGFKDFLIDGLCYLVRFGVQFLLQDGAQIVIEPQGGIALAPLGRDLHAGREVGGGLLQPLFRSRLAGTLMG
jgi:hypothetical protein